MNKQQSSYRQIMKATSLFGGVQVFNIIIKIIRSKAVAVLLGPSGMGIMGLIQSAIGLVNGLTNFGLKTSAVKDIAAANATEDKNKIAVTITIVRRLVWITGVLGTLIMLIFSPWLSEFTFGNRDYTFAFLLISITLLLQQLSNGQLVILQGMRKLQYLAKANMYGSAFGLIITLPLYYYYGVDGIVPSIIGTAFIILILSWYFSRKVKIEPAVVSYKDTFKEGKSMLQMGLMISLSGLLILATSYLVRIFISRTGGVDQVGLYSAGFTIINTYVGLIFIAMGTDYYPRLSAVAHDDKLTRQTVNQQAEIAILILAPILIVFFVFINWIIIILYSNKFVLITDMVHWAALGMFFKLTSWAISHIFLAKAKGKLFFWNELVTNIYLLGFNIAGYYYFGLKGLGISFLLSYFLYFIQVYVITKMKFSFFLERTFVKIFLIQFTLGLISFSVVKFLKAPYNYLIGVVLILISSWYSWRELDNRLGLSKLIKSKFRK